MTPQGRSGASGAVILMLLTLFGSALAGCRAEEQGRVTGYEQGVYQGKKDQTIDEATRDELRERVRRQNNGL